MTLPSLSPALLLFLLFYSALANTQQNPRDPRCGIQGKGLTCGDLGQTGQCCSRFGYCGSSPNHCGIGCQSGCPPPSMSNTNSNPSLSQTATSLLQDSVASPQNDIASLPQTVASVSQTFSSIPQTIASIPQTVASIPQSVASVSQTAASLLPEVVPQATPQNTATQTDVKSQAYTFFPDMIQTNNAYPTVNTITSQATSAASPAYNVRCGRQVRGNLTCAQLGFPGQCCSEFGYCGSHADHCGKGCQSNCGMVDMSGGVTLNGVGLSNQLTAGRCGTQGGGRTCSQQCCSQFGYCGMSDTHCGKGCQSGCTPNERLPPSPPVVPAQVQPSYTAPTPAPMFYPVSSNSVPKQAPSYTTAAPSRNGCLGSGPTYQGAASIFKPDNTEESVCMYGEHRTVDSMDSYAAFLGTQFWESSDACGACLCIHGPSDYVVVKVVGQRPLMGSDMLLSEEAFTQIAPRIADQVTVGWQYIPCPLSGPVSYYFRTGSDGSFPSVQVRNHKYRVTRMEIYKDGAWNDMTLGRGFWSRSLIGGLAGPFSLRVTSITGETLMDRFDTYPGGRVVPGVANFS